MTSTRETLVRAAAALLDGGGVESVTLRKVSALAGVSHNAPYRHFADREALLAAVAARELARRVRAKVPHGRAVERLRLMAADQLAWAERHPARFKLAFGPWSGEHPELEEALGEARRRFIEAVREAQAERDLAPGPPERIAAMVLALAHGAADLALNGRLAPADAPAIGPGELVDDLLALLRARRR